MRRALTSCWGPLVAATLGLPASLAGQQDAPVGLVHGFASDGRTWEVAGPYLQQRFLVRPITPDLPWRFRFEQQAESLNQALPDGTHLVFGHSNGGIVSRQFARQHPRVGMLGTIGSPHRGAPIANNVLKGVVVRWPDAVATNLFETMELYSPDFGYFEPLMRALGYIGHFLGYMRELLKDHGWAAQIAINTFAPVIEQDSVNSSFMQSLNAPEALAAESQRLSRRVAVTTQLPGPVNMLFHTIQPGNEAPWIFWREFLFYGSVVAFEYYNALDPNHPNFDLYYFNAYRWAQIAIDMQDLDPWWCEMIGVLGEYGRGVGSNFPLFYYWCAPSDGFIPVVSQTMPGATRVRSAIPGPSHGEQLRDPSSLRLIEAAFDEDFQTVRRDPNAPASVSLDPRVASIAVGRSITATATVRNATGQAISSVQPTWSVENPQIATITASGFTVQVRGASVGSTKVISRAGIYSDSLTVSVFEVQPLAAGISGPSSILRNESASWSANVTGGIAPYSYQWSVNGSLVSTSVVVSAVGTGSSLRLDLTVSDAEGTRATSTRTVIVESASYH